MQKNVESLTGVQSQLLKVTNPIVVMKLVVKEPSENLKRRQLLPTPEEKEIKIMITSTPIMPD